MNKCSIIVRMRDAFACLNLNMKKRSISTTKYKNSSTTNSLQPIQMAYTSYESDSSVELSSSPIIIMHGMLGSKTNWHSLSKVIHKETNQKVIAVDARNHGDSPHTSEMNYDLLAEDVLQLMNDLSIPKACLIGHSMGGRTMMLFALKYPELVDHLAVVDISPASHTPSMSAIPSYLQALKDVKFKSNQPLSVARKEADKQLSSAVSSAVLRQFFLANIVATGDGTFHWRMNIDSLIENYPNLATFPTIDAKFEGPTYFIGGSESHFLTTEDHEKIYEYFPNAEIEYVEDANHWLHIEKPKEFLAILCKFLTCRQ